MPELPEVETIVRELAGSGICGCRITGAEAFWAKTLTVSQSLSWDLVRGRVIEHVSRRGKYIVLELDHQLHVLIHLRMSGRLSLSRHMAPFEPYLRARLILTTGQDLRFCDPRKFGRWQLVQPGEPPLSGLGPEPLSDAFTGTRLQHALSGRTAAIKTVLLNQSVVAGLGNIYVDESLWHAGIHPLRRANSLSAKEAVCLRKAIRKVLRQAIGGGGTSLGAGRANFYGLSGRPGRNLPRLKVYRRAGQPCRRCGHPVERLVVGQRGTHVCPVCQPHDSR